MESFINKNGNFIVSFDKLIGSGWANPVEKVLRAIGAGRVDRNDISTGWHDSEIEFHVTKGNLEFTLHFDDESSNYLLSKNTDPADHAALIDLAEQIQAEAKKIG